MQSNYWIRIFAAASLAMLAVLLLILSLYFLKGFRYVGSGVSASNTISVSGMGEVFAVPDTATFSVTVMEEARVVKDAQERATDKGNAIKNYLNEQGIDDKDIQTTDYSVYPQYDYVDGTCANGICSPGKQTLRGFQVSHTLTVKVRDTEKAGELLSGVGSLGASQVSGLSFTIDDEDALKDEARDLAIQEARGKANELAKSLGVSVVRVVGFSENGSYPPVPYYAEGRGAATNQAMDVAVAKAPDIAVGQNKIVSNVNITYEIR